MIQQTCSIGNIHAKLPQEWKNPSIRLEIYIEKGRENVGPIKHIFYKKHMANKSILPAKSSMPIKTQ